MDFHPWLSQDGIMYLSFALFSQFDCKKPVFKSKISGRWIERNQIFGRSAAILETEVVNLIQNPSSGDSFDVVAINTPVKSWEDMGFSLPPEPEKKPSKLPDIAQISKHWVFAKPGIMDPPMIQFRFAPPLDNYAGEVKVKSTKTNRTMILKKRTMAFNEPIPEQIFALTKPPMFETVDLDKDYNGIASDLIDH